MNVPSYEFLAFTAVVALAINASSNPQWRRLVLLPANLVFVLTFSRDPAQLAPFGAFLALGYGGIRLVERQKSRALFAGLVAGFVFSFCLLKQYLFVPHALFLQFVYLTVGMSFVFFRVLHLIIDSYQGALPGGMGPVSYLNYALCFPSFVAGPIQLYREYHRCESEEPASLGVPQIRVALGRIVTGFFKVSVLSPLLWYAHSQCVQRLLAAGTLPDRLSSASLVVALFPIYLYFNFSGYTDVVIGAARFLRLELPENFNKPFSAQGYIDFWSRWHMSLANWVKTYVYFPLVMSLMRRRPEPKYEQLFSIVGYFVAFFVVGIWHGQSSMFLFLGFLLGLGVSVNKAYQVVMVRRLGRARYLALCRKASYSSISRGVTFTWWAFSTLWFWSTWAQLAGFVSILGALGTILALGLLIVVASVLLSVPQRLHHAGASLRSLFRVPPLYVQTGWYTALVVITISITVFLNAPASRIVYRAF